MSSSVSKIVHALPTPVTAQTRKGTKIIQGGPTNADAKVVESQTDSQSSLDLQKEPAKPVQKKDHSDDEAEWVRIDPFNKNKSPSHSTKSAPLETPKNTRKQKASVAPSNSDSDRKQDTTRADPPWMDKEVRASAKKGRVEKMAEKSPVAPAVLAI